MNFTEKEISFFNEGCDGGDLGTPENPSIWVFGIEYGDGKYFNPKYPDDGTYNIKYQKCIDFNIRIFKLLSAINNRSAEDWEKFAEGKQPFVKGSKGYYKGNLFPQACHDTDSWDEMAVKETGFERKDDYIKDCKEKRFPLIARFVQYHKPKVIIAAGTGHRWDFAHAFFGEKNPQFQVNEFKRNDGNDQRNRFIYTTVKNGTGLAVIPHFSYGYNYPNDNLFVNFAAETIRNLF